MTRPASKTRSARPRIGATMLSIWLALNLGATAPIRAQAPPAATPSAAQSFRLNLIDAPGGVVVELYDFVRMLESLYPGANSRWDAQRGIVRIEVSGHRFDALTNHNLLILDGRMQTAERPLTVRQDRIFLPVESVQLMLRALNLDFELQTPSGRPFATPSANLPSTATTPVFMPAPDLPSSTTFTGNPSGAPPAQPQLPQFLPGTDTGTTAGEFAAIPSVNLGLLIGEKQPSPEGTPAPPNLTLQAPAGLTPQIGLTWRELADSRHRIPPERIVLVCDEPLRELAAAVRDRINTHPAYQAQVIVAPSLRRDQEVLARDMDKSEPELLIDLAANLFNERSPAPPLLIWVVHEALWPNDRNRSQEGDDPERRYRPHEFQSLALGSLLRGELESRFPRGVIYELAPAYLLRRVAAPSASVLVPILRQGTDLQPALDPELLAQAVSAAVMDYVEGLRGAL